MVLRNLAELVNNMKRYLHIYKQFSLLGLSNIMTYRVGFVSHLIGSTIWGVFHYISIFILTYRIQSIYGWSKPELYLLTGTFGIMWGLFRFLFVKNFHEFSRTILSGRLDTLLVKPIDSQFLMSIWQVSYDEIVRVVLGAIFVAYTISTYHVPVTSIDVVVYFILIFISIISSYSFWYGVSTIIMWQPRLDNIVGLLYTIAGIMRYPPNIMSRFGSTFVFMITPLIFVIAIPTQALIGKASILAITWFACFTVLLFVTTRMFWKYALRSYTSVNN